MLSLDFKPLPCHYNKKPLDLRKKLTQVKEGQEFRHKYTARSRSIKKKVKKHNKEKRKHNNTEMK